MSPHWTVSQFSEQGSCIFKCVLYDFVHTACVTWPPSPDSRSHFPSLSSAFLKHHRHTINYAFKTCNLRGLEMCLNLWQHHHTQNIHHTQFPVLLCNTFFLPLPAHSPFPDDHSSASCHYRLICIFYGKYIFRWASFAKCSLWNKFWNSPMWQCVATVMHFIAEEKSTVWTHCMSANQWMSVLPVSGHLSYSPSLAVTHTAAVKVCGEVFTWLCALTSLS